MNQRPARSVLAQSDLPEDLATPSNGAVLSREGRIGDNSVLQGGKTRTDDLAGVI